MSFLGFGQKSPDEVRKMIEQIKKEIKEIDGKLEILKEQNKKNRDAQFDFSEQTGPTNRVRGIPNFRGRKSEIIRQRLILEEQKGNKLNELREFERALNILEKK